jgi:hypothetical protein
MLSSTADASGAKARLVPTLPGQLRAEVAQYVAV